MLLMSELRNAKKQMEVCGNGIKIVDVVQCKVDNEKEELRGKLEIANKENEQLRAAIVNYKSSTIPINSDDKNWKMNLEDMILKLEEDKRNSSKELDRMRSLLGEKGNNEEFKNQLNDLQGKMNDADTRLEQKELIISKLEQENQNLYLQIEKIVEAKVTDNKMLTDCKKVLASVREQMTSFQIELCRKEQLMAELEQEKTNLLSIIEEAEAKNVNAIKEREEIKQHLEMQLQNMHEELKKKENLSNGMESQNSSDRQQWKETENKLLSENYQLKEQLRILQDQLVEFQQKSNENHQAVQKLESDKSSLIERLSEMTTSMRCKDGSGDTSLLQRDTKSSINLPAMDESDCALANNSYFDKLLGTSITQGIYNCTSSLSVSSNCTSSFEVRENLTSSPKVVSDVERLQQTIAKLEKEKAQLGIELQLKSRDQIEVKDDVQEFKLIIKKLEQTIFDLAEENKKLTEEKKPAQVIFKTSMTEFCKYMLM